MPDRRAGTAVWWVLAAAVLVLAPAALAGWVWSQPERISGLDLATPATHEDAQERGATEAVPGRRVFLLAGIGGGELTDEEARRLAVPDYRDRAGVRRTDALMLVSADQRTGEVAVVSLPRDTWLPWRGHKLNASLPSGGHQRLVDDVERLTGEPVHHLVTVNFRGFAAVVDAVGGVDVEITRPKRDRNAHLDIPNAPASGCARLDGPTALSWARSRSLEVYEGGRWRPADQTTPFGRAERQQELAANAWERLRGPALVNALPSLVNAASDDLSFDDGLGVAEARELAAAFASVAAEDARFERLPGELGRRGGQSVVLVDDAAADELFDRLRQPGGNDDTGAPDDSPSGGTEADADDEEEVQSDQPSGDVVDRDCVPVQQLQRDSG